MTFLATNYINAPYSHGCHIPISIKELPDQQIFISKCCFKLSNKQDAYLSDVIKTIIRDTWLFKRFKLKNVKKGYGYGIFPNGEQFNE